MKGWPDHAWAWLWPGFVLSPFRVLPVEWWLQPGLCHPLQVLGGQ